MLGLASSPCILFTHSFKFQSDFKWLILLFEDKDSFFHSPKIQPKFFSQKVDRLLLICKH